MGRCRKGRDTTFGKELFPALLAAGQAFVHSGRRILADMGIAGLIWTVWPTPVGQGKAGPGAARRLPRRVVGCPCGQACHARTALLDRRAGSHRRGERDRPQYRAGRGQRGGQGKPHPALGFAAGKSGGPNHLYGAYSVQRLRPEGALLNEAPSGRGQRREENAVLSEGSTLPGVMRPGDAADVSLTGRGWRQPTAFGTAYFYGA
jgi:hypothetical protein